MKTKIVSILILLTFAGAYAMAADVRTHYFGIGRLLKTGQTTSYATGDDGDLEVGIIRSYTYTDPITSEATNTLTDNSTGLMWIRDCTLVNGTGGATGGNQDISGTMNWATALSRCNALTYAGKSDWRLPNIYELFGICVLDAGLTDPYIDQTYFPNTVSSYYWSATTNSSYTDNALLVGFNGGYVYSFSKTNSRYVRCVRGGQ